MEVIPACMQFLYTNRPLAMFFQMFTERFIFLFTVFCVHTVIFQLCGSTLLYFSGCGEKKKKQGRPNQADHHISLIFLPLRASSSPLTVSTFNCNLQPLLHLVSHCSLCLFTVLIRWAGRWWVYLGPSRPAMSYLSDMLEQRQCLLFIVF